MPYHPNSTRREMAERPESPFQPESSTKAPSMWGELPSEQEGSFDRPATPRMSGALPANQDTRRWGFRPSNTCGGYSTSDPDATSVNNDGDNIRGQLVEEKHASDTWSNAPHRRMLSREDAALGNKESFAPNDWDATWEECGLSGSKTSRARQKFIPNEGKNIPGGWGRCNSPVEKTGTRGNWNEYANAHRQEVGASINQKPTAVGHSRRASNVSSRTPVPVIPVNESYDLFQNSDLQQRGEPRVYNRYTHSIPYGSAERKPNHRINPDNYDGNRAGPDGSRVFYSAILPTVPTLRDIGNHAEYTAWFDMLRSILKYHQLTAVLALNANRPHGYKEGRRWDQDRLRAAIIIKGALSFDVFERVRRNGWRDTEDPAETVEKVRETHGAVCPCGHSQGMTLLDF